MQAVLVPVVVDVIDECLRGEAYFISLRLLTQRVSSYSSTNFENSLPNLIGIHSRMNVSAAFASRKIAPRQEV